MNLFEIASRKGYRFASGKGLLTVEDLWIIPLTTGQANLNDVAKTISATLKQEQEETFVQVKKPTVAQTDETNKLEIVKRIIAVRLQENEDKEKAKARKEARAKIEDLLSRKQDQELEGKSVEELQQMLDAL